MLRDKEFCSDIETLFTGDPSGRLDIPTLQDAIERIARLENKLSQIEQQLRKSKSA